MVQTFSILCTEDIAEVANSTKKKKKSHLIIFSDLDNELNASYSARADSQLKNYLQCMRFCCAAPALFAA